jgi:hypothetical protein
MVARGIRQRFISFGLIEKIGGEYI